MSDVKEKDIPGFEGIYKVTENGDIISCRKSKKLSHGIKPGGYAFVGLYPGGGKRPSYKMVHRIVAEVF
ncbi:TPA: NUMOD4 domain-containing protein, partial [Escherichia coli]